MSMSGGEGRGGGEGGAVGGVAQQRLADALAEDPRLAAGGAHDRPAHLLALAGATVRAQPAGAAVEGDLRALGGLDRDAGEPRDRLRLVRAERQRDLLAAPARAALVAAVVLVERVDLPSQPGGQP